MSSRKTDPAPVPRAGFTLLEIMLGVMILALVTLTIFRFLENNLRAIAFSAETSAAKLRVDGLLATLAAEFADIPASRQNALLGEPHLFGDLPTDELAWITGPGNGLFTRHAPGEYRALLVVRNRKGQKGTELGIERSLADEPDSETSWLPLIPDMQGMEVRYFDPRLDGWSEKWQDGANRPSLIRLRLWPEGASDPVEAILPVPSSSVRAGGAANLIRRTPGGQNGSPPQGPQGPQTPGANPEVQVPQ